MGEERVLQQSMQALEPAASRLFAFLQAPLPAPFAPNPLGLNEDFHCEFGFLYCDQLRPFPNQVGQCLYLIPRMVKESDAVIAAAIEKYLEKILTSMQRTNPTFSFRWNLFFVDLLIASANPVLNDLRYPSIASIRHAQRCLELWDQFNEFSAIEEFRCDVCNCVRDFLHKAGLVLTHHLLWAEAEPASRARASAFGLHLFSAALAGTCLNLHALTAASCAVLRRHKDVDRSLLASVLTVLVLRLPPAQHDVPPLMEVVIGAVVRDWASGGREAASRETELLGVSAESLMRRLLKLLLQCERPLARGWLGCLLAELRKAQEGSLEAVLVALCIQDDELLWRALNCFLELEKHHVAELGNCLPCRHRLFLETMKAVDYDDEFLIDSLLTADASEVGLLTYLITYLHSDPAHAAAVFSSDRAAQRRLRDLLRRLHTRLQRSAQLETFPFNVSPLARSLALFGKEI